MIRDLTKSTISFSWGMGLFGAQQLANLLTPQSPSQPTHTATAAFNALSRATEEQLGSTLSAAYRAGDKFQKGVSDLTFSFLTLDGFNPSQFMSLTSDIMKQSSDALRENP